MTEREKKMGLKRRKKEKNWIRFLPHDCQQVGSWSVTACIFTWSDELAMTVGNKMNVIKNITNTAS
jgi:hypothetical protein